MSASTWFWRVLCVTGVIVGLCLVGPSRADEKDKKGSGKDDKKVIVIQLDASKLSPDVLKKLLEVSKNPGKDDDKRAAKKDDDKKPALKKDAGKKPNIVQVDLSKLPPDLAKRLSAGLSKNPGKDDDKKGKAKRDDDDDDRKKGGKGKDKKDDDDDDKKSGEKGSKGKDKDDDDDKRKGGKKRDD